MANPATVTLRKKAIIHQVTTMLTISKNVIFQGPNHLLSTGAGDPTLDAWVIIKVMGYQQVVRSWK